jgi:dolichyl-phosphate beta-glucosyltransferase
MMIERIRNESSTLYGTYRGGAEGARSNFARSLLLLLLGAGVTGVALLWNSNTGVSQSADNWLRAFGWMLSAVLGGQVLRALRRYVFFGNPFSMHQASSFEMLIQGAKLLNPQLPDPGVEREFLARETGIPEEGLKNWFRVQPLSALVTPAVLGGVILLLSGNWIIGVPLVLFSLAVLAVAGSEWRIGTGDRRLSAAVGIGVLAAVVEGTGFMLACRVLQPDFTPWQGVLLYLVILTAFELSPIPGALGVLEVAYLAFAAFPVSVLPGMLIPMVYRLCRTVPALLLTVFYLPRYKLQITELFHPLLPSALARSQRPAGGWQDEEKEGEFLLSVIIPAYNEEERLPLYLPGVVEHLESLDGGFEVLVVDDGSSDGTANYVRSLAETRRSVRLIQQDRNRGKGAAVKMGVSRAKGRYVLFADADGATPIEELQNLLDVARRGVEVVIASREQGSVERSAIRAWMGVLFYRLTNLLAVPGISDTQCGFKLFRRVAARHLFPKLKEAGWAFDVELLFMAQKDGMAIEEVPVRWTAIAGSKISPVRDAVKMMVAIVRIRRRKAGLTDSLLTGEAFGR